MCSGMSCIGRAKSQFVVVPGRRGLDASKAVAPAKTDNESRGSAVPRKARYKHSWNYLFNLSNRERPEKQQVTPRQRLRLIWLLVRDQEVDGSNLLAPTSFLQTNQTVTATLCSTTASGSGSSGSIETNEAGTLKPTAKQFTFELMDWRKAALVLHHFKLKRALPLR